MYNRYIPQSDGSYQRKAVPDPVRHTPIQHQRPKPPEPVPPPPPPPPPRQPRSCSKPCPGQKSPPRSSPPSQGVGSFLKQLLPGDFDTGDLMVVLLLLLISADGCEDRSNALLTLALYLLL